MRISHHQDFSLSLGMGMPPTKDVIMNPIVQQGLAMGAKMTLIDQLQQRELYFTPHPLKEGPLGTMMCCSADLGRGCGSH